VALLRFLLMAAVVFVITRWLRRALTGGGSVRRQQNKKPWWDDEKRRGDAKPKLQTLEFRRDPHEVLGLEKGVNREAAEEARERLLKENSPDAVASMSEDLQELARRKTDEIESAFASLIEEE
jgi:DnaJ-domain-containing protein 1